jgi:uncharacterized protein (TIGR02001 family)
MRQRLGWIAAFGLTSIASPSLAKANIGLSDLTQPEFDPLSSLVADQHLDAQSFSDFGGVDRLTPPSEKLPDYAFGTSGWDGMMRSLEDSGAVEEGAVEATVELTPDLASFSLSNANFRSELVSAAAAEGGGESAASETPPPFDISATLTGVSDYRFRGLSLSGRDPAIQGSVDVEHQSGFYVGVWGSTISEFAGAHTEVDVYGGWRGSLGGLEVDAGVTGYFYPSGQDATYFELTGSLGYSLGPAEMKLGVAYAPDQANLGSDDSLYAYGQVKAAIPGTPVTLVAQAGHEKGGLAGPTGKKWDWSLGAQIIKDKFTLGLSYVDTDIDRLFDPDKVAHPGVVLSLSISI